MARGTNAYGLDARDRRFDSGCAARFFRYETSAMSHEVESEVTARFFFILKSWKVLIFFGEKVNFNALIINYDGTVKPDESQNV